MRKHRRPSFHHYYNGKPKHGLVSARTLITSKQYDALLAECERQDCDLKTLLTRCLRNGLAPLLPSDEKYPEVSP